MITRNPVTFRSANDQPAKLAGTLDDKGFAEYVAAVHFTTIWHDILGEAHGELKALSHCTNPDDPPDIIAHFDQRDLNIEVTNVDPAHVHQCDRLHRKVGRNAGRSEIPLSKAPRDAEEARAIMYIPGHPDAWENVTDRIATRADLFFAQANKKLTNPRMLDIDPGILPFTGDIYGDQFERPLIETALKAIHETIPASRTWILATAFKWNPSSYYSAMLHPSLGYHQRP